MQFIPINRSQPLAPGRRHCSLAPRQTHDRRTYVDCCIFKFVVDVVVVVVCSHLCLSLSLFFVVRRRRCSLLLLFVVVVRNLINLIGRYPAKTLESLDLQIVQNQTDLLGDHGQDVPG